LDFAVAKQKQPGDPYCGKKSGGRTTTLAVRVLAGCVAGALAADTIRGVARNQTRGRLPSLVGKERDQVRTESNGSRSRAGSSESQNSGVSKDREGRCRRGIQFRRKCVWLRTFVGMRAKSKTAIREESNPPSSVDICICRVSLRPHRRADVAGDGENSSRLRWGTSTV
jgi:hypothetical protein